ncbi:ABC-2 type transporter-domain-containing protein [Macrophomina phaseolina]|uniref:ABC-2 type transporter-domain-containing protein n=1 Tax=Macrophomina phaseolina TaxID=35725 RepID=A0ABQ8GIN7_9PEZI|nr:ABC-2 type transporter-domain-containing protein [Macrophomina phaseolina]
MDSETQSEKATPSPADPEKNYQLDTSGGHFNTRAWANITGREESQHAFGVSFQGLSVDGHTSGYQNTVGNVLFQALQTGHRRVSVLKDLEGTVEAGEMLLVLGPPGSGCSTFLKSISGRLSGATITRGSRLNFGGLTSSQLKADASNIPIYVAEADIHLPSLTVGDTLAFAAKSKSPRSASGVTDETYIQGACDAVMTMLGISHTRNTIVGDSSVRGISGGEKKRVSIAEALLMQAPLQCWDNSTAGLDSKSALEFCNILRMESDLKEFTSCVALNTVGEDAYKLFNKVLMLYEGRQIYFGPVSEAKGYFEGLGFHFPELQTTPDFLISMTEPSARRVRPGYANDAPKTPDGFAACWEKSRARKQVITDIQSYEMRHHLGQIPKQSVFERLGESSLALNYAQQVSLCLWRGAKLLKSNPALVIAPAVSGIITALIVGSVFYDLQDNTNGLYARGSLMFFIMLINSFTTAVELLSLYEHRPVVEKHAGFGLYRPSAEAFASVLVNIPYKVLNSITFNLTCYFMTNLRREAGAFFFFLILCFLISLTMSLMFRTVGAATTSAPQALVISTLLILAIPVYSGFPLPTRYMLGWSRWINYINPMSYAFEALMSNEFNGRRFACSEIVPSGPGYDALASSGTMACATIGAIEDFNYVDGDAYLWSVYGYPRTHRWRNSGIVIGFLVGFLVLYLLAAEFVPSKKARGEVLLFRRKKYRSSRYGDIENGTAARPSLQKREPQGTDPGFTSAFSWSDVCFDIPEKSKGGEGTRRLLHGIDGWVGPGSLTALMGVSGAGKTTLLDALATRNTTGVVSGIMLIGGKEKPPSFQRDVGYVQQQDVHLPTSTVREALNFSAILRQKGGTRAERLAYADEVIHLLGLEDCADAVVGERGESLNTKQRKLLTIGIELAAKPNLLFLDEPTSGLDALSSWAIVEILRKVANNGLAVLCTIHQPSAMLLQQFDRLLLLAQGGRTVYFGDLGDNFEMVTSYFVDQGAEAPTPGVNHAEWILELASPSSEVDWPAVWLNGKEYSDVKSNLQTIQSSTTATIASSSSVVSEHGMESIASFATRFSEVTARTFQHYWRSPWYLYSKAGLCLWSALFVGFSFFNASTSIQGLQNQRMAIFMLFAIGSQLVQQSLPHFIAQRVVFEVRELHSRMYSWRIFILSNIVVEVFWGSFVSLILFFCWYYPTGFYRDIHAEQEVHTRGLLTFFLIWTFLFFVISLSQLVIAAVDSDEGAAKLSNLVFILSLLFCGVLVEPAALPGFWKFMYRVTPLTYLVDAMLSVNMGGKHVKCAENEIVQVQPPAGNTCQTYLMPYMNNKGGYLIDGNATSDCQYCSIDDSDAYLAQFDVSYRHRWRNLGLLFVYICFNISMALFLYYSVRIRKRRASRR